MSPATKVRTRNFKELEAKMSPERLARSSERARQMLAELPLDQLREARKLSQAQLAEQMEVSQSEISRLESRTDMYVSTLGRIIEAMGGRLEIRAVFPDGAVQIKKFSE